MKHFYTRALMLILALTWLVPKANASGWSFSINETSNWWKSATAISYKYTSSAVTNDNIFTACATSNTNDMILSNDGTQYFSKGYRINSSGVVDWSSGNLNAAFPFGTGLKYFYLGPAIASDSEGSLLLSSRGSSSAPSTYPWSNVTEAITCYTVLPNGPVATNPVYGTRSGFLLNTTTYGDCRPSGRADYMSAYGKCVSGTGYLWFAINEGTKIERVTVTQRQATKKTVYTAPENTGTRGWVYQYADNKVVFVGGAYTQANGNTPEYWTARKIWRGTINSAGTSITWEDLGITTISSQVTMFTLRDCEFVAYSSSSPTATAKTEITIKNVTTGQIIGKPFSPFNTESAQEYTIHSLNSKVNSDGTAYLYVYVPGVAGARYTIKSEAAQDPVQNLAVKIVKDQDPTQLSRQDAILTWGAPAKGEVSKYTIYSRENPWFSMEGNGVDSNNDGYSDGPQWRQHTWSAWKAIGTTTELTFTDIDVCMYGSSIPRSYQYKVVPTFSTGTTGSESNIIEITPGFVPFVPVWDTTMDQDDKKFGIDRYDGYCKVQLYWKFPQVNNYDYFPSGQKNVYGVKPDYYSILRNGKEIATNITCYNYIDTNVKSEQTYTYEVVSHYYDFPNDTAVSTPNTVYVEKRDWAKVGYELTEIYNYKIASSGSNVHIPASSYASIVTNLHAYYQGAFHNGYWYIVQANDGTTSTTSGGIIKISATDPKENANNNILKAGTKIKSFSNGLSNGIASDDEGNLFVQSSTFGSRLKTGTIYFNDGNGNYGNGYTVDLSGIDLTEYNEVNPAKYLTTAAGRVDYYSMKGNLRTKGEAYLYLAPSISRAVFVIKLTYNGSKVTATLHNKFQDADGRRRWNNEPFLQNNENIAIPVRCAGRENEFLHLIRSSALSLWACHDDANQKAGRITNVYDTQARVNTPGGCTLEFNGELFLITPTSQFSVNKGNFYIGMAERKTADDTPATANFGHIIPIIMYNQADAEDGGGNASGTVSIHAEVGKEDVNGDGILNDYADIYMYAPQGLRFAKYRLTPSTGFPPSQVRLDIKAIYDKDYEAGTLNPGGDIKQFDATASWLQVTDYGNTEGGNVFYNIQSYTLQLVDAAGNPISEKDKNGNLLFPAIEFDVDANNVPTTVYTVTYDDKGVKIKTSVSSESDIYKNLTWREITRTDKNGDVVKDTNGNDIKDIEYSYVYKDVKKGFDYTALVTVNYVGVDESNTGVKQKSQVTEWEATNTYQPEEATGTVLVDVKKNNWSDWDVDYYGNPAKNENDPDDAYYDKYRVCLKLANPVFKDENGNATTVYPRSYYTIGIDKNKDGVVDQKITNFHLYVGTSSAISTKEFKTMSTTVADADGYIEITDGQIPGDYDFDQSTGTGDNVKPHVYWDMLDYTAPAYYNDGVTYTETDNPSTWNYIVTTTYAAGNTRISENVTSPMAADNGGITTGVEVISTQSVLNVYPIPATISVTIKCSEEIEKVEIYSASGLLVKIVEGNADQVMTVDVSDLASGYYFMRVNDLSPVRIIKN